MTDRKAIVVELAGACGFDLVRVTSAAEFAADREAALRRIQDGHMDGLPWYTAERVNRGSRPDELLPGARSIICLGQSYLPPGDDLGPAAAAPLAASGRVARYAWVKDYHRSMKRRMRDFVREVASQLGSDVAARWYVDDGPMLDRAAAVRSGLGWFGKNTNVLTPSHGSWVFLGQVITDLDLTADPPLQKTCGACVLCIDACPTGAIVAPYVIDNTRCISYLTIENRGPIPRDLRPLMQDWVFGCDICQDVCPVNRKAHPAADPIPEAPAVTPSLPASAGVLELVGLLEMNEEEFRDAFRGTSIMRAKHVGMQRNACVALGNLRAGEGVPPLRRALLDGHPLVRGHAAWALGRIATAEAVKALTRARDCEGDQEVLEEIDGALNESDGLFRQP